MAAPAKEAPWCVIFLVAGTLLAHSLVLIGNLTTAGMLHSLGLSTNGWSLVGTDLAVSLTQDLEPAMNTVSSGLTQTIQVVTQIQKSADVALSMSGSSVDAALEKFINTTYSSDDVQHFKDQLLVTLRKVAQTLLDKISPLIDKLVGLLRPALEQVQEWLTTFGSKIQAQLEMLSTTVDKVQKIFDQVMSQASPGTGSNEEYMVYNTYTLFDTDNSGVVKAEDLKSVSQIFGIPALAGQKATELVQKYDSDGKGGLDEQEFTLFVNDPSVPGIMTVVLRTYSRKLAHIGGQVGSATMRDEVARAVADYFALVCSKNMSRVSWVSQALTNGSVPIQFTADVLKELAIAKDNPDSISDVDTGAVVLREMVRLDSGYVAKALTLLGSAAFWASEGFDGQDQPAVLSHLAGWLAGIPSGPATLQQGLGLQTTNLAGLEKAAYQLGQEQQTKYVSTHMQGQADDQSSLFASSCAQVLRDQLLGGSGAAGQQDAAAEQAVRGGQKALPATLKFAEWLANNATDTANGHLRECFDFSGQSSAALESFAMQVSGFITKTQNFLNVMSSYASPHGMNRLMSQSVSFVKSAAEDVVTVCEDYVDARIAELECALPGAAPCNASAATPAWLRAGSKELSLDVNGAFGFVTRTLHDLKGVLPTVIKDLKFAKKEVSSVSNNLNSVMTVLGLKAPPLFYQISALYKGAWVAYFVFFGMLTVGILFYGFWASGFCGGPQAGSTDEGYQAPRTTAERFLTLCGSCCACVRGCHDSHLCFWSMLLLAEVLVLVLFVVSIAICILAGVQAFMMAGCAQVYILGDDSVCTTALQMLGKFLKGFGLGGLSLQDTCSQEKLMTCRVIQDEAATALKLSIFGAILATLLSMQMVVESAVMHERARFSRMFDAKAKKP